MKKCNMGHYVVFNLNTLFIAVSNMTYIYPSKLTQQVLELQSQNSTTRLDSISAHKYTIQSRGENCRIHN